MRSNYRSVYIAFDQFPSFKGAATHITQMVSQLQTDFPDTLLLTLPGKTIESVQGSYDHFPIKVEETNFLKRASLFSHEVNNILSNQYNMIFGHFRDIWGGMAVLNHKHIIPVFEVNGLPSIELPYRYPSISRDTLKKVEALEQTCLLKSELIICPSQTIRKYLEQRGVQAEKIEVVTNGADIPIKNPQAENLPENYMIYFGALQPWQGVDVLIKSLTYLRDKEDFYLVICSSHKEKFARPLKKLAEKLDVSSRIIWKDQLEKNELNVMIQHARFSVAPLIECSRNLKQGCSPLKIFESLANGTPVIASDLPVVREIVVSDVEAKLFRAGRPADLAKCIRILLDNPDFLETLSTNGIEKIRVQFTWEKIRQRMSGIYEKLLVY
ncbi:glycosyltransferase [Fulvivirgaceae bacterium BMA10]|uniref:Glycosyltransferase n=1 Tax=Splendidivirga corallicola TaxID=3051826 RepID=A0ABT8KSF3_9BACT|nr:glycosyltransferase [Fulvivirgaceae bacterium BMA10]